MSLFRYEEKFIIDRLQAEEIRMRIAAVCDVDPQAGRSGRYNIRSLYFDDYADSAYHANETGTEPRSKWRLRIYNHDPGMIRLEQKIKMHSKIRKDSAEISKDLCCRLMENADNAEYPAGDRVVNRFLTDCFTKGLRPKIIVEYNREPYVYDVGDVRITFDTGICFSDQIDRFFEEDIFRYPVQEAGRLLLEVKYTEVLPGFLHDLLDTGGLQKSTFSKYYLGRKLGRGLGI